MQMSHLPIPPPLPWSTDSPQFMRHMQLLSQAVLSSTPEASWAVYEGLHADLRPAIPDDVFVSLIRHQLYPTNTDGSPLPPGSADIRKSRVKELLTLARKCEMDPTVLPVDLMERLLGTFFVQEQRKRFDQQVKNIILWLWPVYKSHYHNGSFSTMPIEMRRRWLHLCCKNNELRSDPPRLWEVLEEIVENGGAQGLEVKAGQAVSIYKGDDEDMHFAGLRQAAWCLAREVNIPSDDLVLLMFRITEAIGKRLPNKGGEEFIRAVNRIGGLIEELRDGGADEAANTLEASLDKFIQAQQLYRDDAPASTVAMASLSRALLFLRERLSRQFFTPAPKASKRARRLTDSDRDNLNLLLRHCVRSLTWEESDNQYILGMIIPVITSHPVDTELLLQFVDALIVTGMIITPAIPTDLKAQLFEAFLKADHLGDLAVYSSAMKLYSALRRKPAPAPSLDHARIWRWTDRAAWKLFFNRALSHGHLHFASRLYMDIQADGLRVPRAQSLAFIRAIASKPSSSRLVLLERYIKDLLYEPNAQTNDLIAEIWTAMANSPREAALAFQLVRRINPAAPIPYPIIDQILPQLALSSLAEHRTLATQLLSIMPDTPHKMAKYHEVLAQFNKSIRTADLGMESSLAVYKSMYGDKGADADPRSRGHTVSLLLDGMCKLDQLDMALGMFRESVGRKVSLTQNGPASLMIKLSLALRLDEAYTVEKEFYSVVPADNKYPRMVGARIVADILSGVDIDLAVYYNPEKDVMRMHKGYRPSPRFYKFLQDLQVEAQAGLPGMSDTFLAKDDEADGGEPPGAEPETASMATTEGTAPEEPAENSADVEPERERASAAVHFRKAAQPLTRSWSGVPSEASEAVDGHGEWTLDKEWHHSVNMLRPT